MKLSVSVPLVLSLALLAGTSAQAAPVLVEHTFDGNDCAGYFGQSFESCKIAVGDTVISPVIAKYEADNGGSVEINDDLYPTFSGSEISIDHNAQTWSYDQGSNDPSIRFWSAKGGNYFNLFWYVDSEFEADCASDTYSLSCMQHAMAVDSGSWATPTNPNNDKPFGLSHLTFFNSEEPVTVPVPEPGSVALLLSGILGLFLARRRRRGWSA